jgi:ADP-heptose:LPS heptosyltransferase
MLTDLTNRTIVFLDFFRCLAMWLAASILCLSAQSHPQRPKKKVLIIRLDAIGDFILWLDAAQEIRKLYPPEAYEITLLGNHDWTSLAMELPWFDEVWPLKRRKYRVNPIYCIKILSKVHRAGFDLVINPTYSREFKYSDIFAKASGAQERIGSQGDFERIRKWQKYIGNRWYTRLIHAQEEPLMELERNAEFVRGLGAENFLAGVPELPVSSGVPDGFNAHDYFVIFPGAGAVARQWPMRNFAEIAEKVHRKTGWRGIICGGPDDESLGKNITAETDAPLDNWAGRTSLPELVAIIAEARLVVANETSAVHIAAAVSVPAVCIFGGGHFGRFMPYRIEVKANRPLPVPVVFRMDCFGCKWLHCHYASKKETPPCICNIPVDTVWSAVSDILEKRNNNLPQEGNPLS